MSTPHALWKFSAVNIGIAALLLAGRSSRAHGTGLYATETEALTRAQQIGCTTVLRTTGSGCRALTNRTSTGNFASNELTTTFKTRIQNSSLASSDYLSPIADHSRARISVKLALGAKN